jgi:hypothetical protein
MALSNYSELVTELTAWVDARGDSADQIPEAVRMFESMMNLELRCREMVTSSNITITDGTGTLPTDFLAALSVVENSSPARVLNYFSLEGLTTHFDTSSAGLGCGYTVYGETIQVAPKPSNTVALTYYQEIPNLEANSTNWLMTKYPALYMEGCQMELYRYHKMDQDLAISTQRVREMVQMLNDHGDWEFLGNSSPSLSNLGPVF